VATARHWDWRWPQLTYASFSRSSPGTVCELQRSVGGGRGLPGSAGTPGERPPAEAAVCFLHGARCTVHVVRCTMRGACCTSARRDPSRRRRRPQGRGRLGSRTVSFSANCAGYGMAPTLIRSSPYLPAAAARACVRLPVAAARAWLRRAQKRAQACARARGASGAGGLGGEIRLLPPVQHSPAFHRAPASERASARAINRRCRDGGGGAGTTGGGERRREASLKDRADTRTCTGARVRAGACAYARLHVRARARACVRVCRGDAEMPYRQDLTGTLSRRKARAQRRA
jgi:hypothetical protein